MQMQYYNSPLKSNLWSVQCGPIHSLARRADSDGGVSASGSAGPGFNFHLKIFNLGARKGGNVHFLIARLYITSLD